MVKKSHFQAFECWFFFFFCSDNTEKLFLCIHIFFFSFKETNMSDKSDLKAELERKKQRLAQIREEKKRKEEERKKKEVNTGYWGVPPEQGKSFDSEGAVKRIQKML